MNPRQDVALSFARLSGPARGALYMVGSCAAFALMMALVRLVAADIHPFVAAFFRNLLGLGFMLPWLFQAGPGSLKTGRWPVHVLRATMGLAAMLSLFTALSLLPLAEATALSFSAPLFATAGAALILGERVRLRRWTATAVGFVGTLIILRPGADIVEQGALIALAAAVFIAGAMLSIKSLSRTENPNAIVVIMGLLMTPASLVPALFFWTTPDALTFAWLLLMGLSATIGQVLLTRAFATAEASAVLPFDFSRLIFVAALGYLMFGEVPDGWTWLGASLIVAATVYIARREARLGQAPPPAPPPAH
jgi:drug/metabolite transporter (DMT)-like permease